MGTALLQLQLSCVHCTLCWNYGHCPATATAFMCTLYTLLDLQAHCPATATAFMCTLYTLLKLRALPCYSYYGHTALLQLQLSCVHCTLCCNYGHCPATATECRQTPPRGPRSAASVLIRAFSAAIALVRAPAQIRSTCNRALCHVVSAVIGHITVRTQSIRPVIAIPPRPGSAQRGRR
jgi:hypothetical protein